MCRRVFFVRVPVFWVGGGCLRDMSLLLRGSLFFSLLSLFGVHWFRFLFCRYLFFSFARRVDVVLLVCCFLLYLLVFCVYIEGVDRIMYLVVFTAW